MNAFLFCAGLGIFTFLFYAGIALVIRVANKSAQKSHTRSSEVIVFDGLTDKEKEEIVYAHVTEASSLLLKAFMSCSLKTHIETMVVNDPTDERFFLSFRKIPSKPEPQGGGEK